MALRIFSLTRIPLLAYLRPVILDVTPERIIVGIKHSRRTRNHLGSMYIAALCAGADCATGGLAMYFMRRHKVPVSMIFRDFQADFHKRAEGDVHFICEQGREIARLVEQAAQSDQRVEETFEVLARVPEQGGELVATFRLTLSLKRRDQTTRLRASPR